MFDVPFWILATIVIIVLYTSSRRHRERIEMIKKGMTQSLYAETPGLKSGSKTLFLGLLGTAAGLAFLISPFFMNRRDEGMIVAGTLFLFCGCAMLLYWKLTAKDRDHERRLQEEYLTKAASLPVKKEEKSEDAATEVSN